MSSPAILFDPARVRKRRKRAARSFTQHDFLLRQAAESLIESLQHLTYAFPTVLEIGASGHLTEYLATRPGTHKHLQSDSVAALPHTNLVLNPEQLPIAEHTVDAVLSAGGMHFINDLPGTLIQIGHALKPDGLFMATFPGPDTLRELRQVFAATDSALHNGISPRIAPFPDVRDAGGLLQRAGFALPVADRDIITVSYPTLFALMEDLRGSGQVNMLQQQVQHFTSKRFFSEAAKRYADQFSDAEGRITATFEIVTLTAWKPAASQQQPAKRGSGQISLTQVLN